MFRVKGRVAVIVVVMVVLWLGVRGVRDKNWRSVMFKVRAMG